MTFLSIDGLRLPSTNVRSQVIYYARTGGDDSNDGSDPGANAVATWGRLMQLVDRNPARGVHQVLEGTGVDWTEADFRSLPEVYGGHGSNLDFGGAGGGKQNILDYPLEFRADPTLELAVTVTGTATAAIGETRTITVSETLVPAAHVGMQLIGAGLVEYGSIISNTANDLVVASAATTWTGPVYIVSPSSTWTFGDAGNFFEGSVDYVAMCATAFTGIGFTFVGSFGGPTFNPVNYISYQLCSFNGIGMSGGGRTCVFDACDITGNFAQNGAPALIRASTLRNITWNCHGEGGNGLSGFSNCEFDACAAVGGGNVESSYNFSIKNSRINNAAGGGVGIPSPLKCNLVNVYFENIVGDCITNSNGGTVLITNCGSDLSSVGGVGLRLEGGSRAEVSSVATLQGTGGDVQVGAHAATNWAAAQQHDFYAQESQQCSLTGAGVAASSIGIRTEDSISSVGTVLVGSSASLAVGHIDTNYAGSSIVSSAVEGGSLSVAAISGGFNTLVEVEATGPGAWAGGRIYGGNYLGGTEIGLGIKATAPGSFAHGEVYFGSSSSTSVDTTMYILASGDGSFATGHAALLGSITAGDAYQEIAATGQGSFAGGSVSTSFVNFAYTPGGGSKIKSLGGGSLAYGKCASDNDGLSALIEASNSGAAALGYATDGGTIRSSGGGSLATGAVNTQGLIHADRNGDVAHGYCISSGVILSSGNGSDARGYCSAGTIQATASGSSANGYVSGTGRVIEATQQGANAQGYAAAFDIKSTARGSHAHGYADTANIEATAFNATQFGPGVNATADSLQVGGGMMLKASGQFGGVNVAITLAAAATTFVTASNCMSVTGDPGSNTITTISGGISGQEMSVIFKDALVTITNDDSGVADTIDLSAALTGAAGTVLKLLYDGTSWYEVSRSVN